MKQCKQCGANLPDNAHYCLQCGASADMQDPHAPGGGAPLNFIQPAMIGGAFLGVMSSIPIISAANVLCCMWVLAGGAIAAIMLSKQRPGGAITYGDGAYAGVLSGVFGAIIGTVISIPVHIISARFFRTDPQEIEKWLDQLGVEGQMRDWAMQMLSGDITVLTVMLTFVGNLLLWSLFAMLGGIIAVAVMDKQKAKGGNSGAGGIRVT